MSYNTPLKQNLLNLISLLLGNRNCRSAASFLPPQQLEADLIFVTNLTNQVGGEKICHVEKFQLSMRDDCGKI